MYQIRFTKKADADIERFKRSGDKQILIKIDALVKDIKSHPRTGIGKPEQLKHYIEETWSRRITDKHRLVYEIQDEVVIVEILKAYGHYEDK